MAYTLKQGLNYVYPIISQHGATRAIGSQHFLHVSNHALNLIYNYQGQIWTWQHVKDVFNLYSDDKLKWRLYTRRPIESVDRFYTSSWSDVEGQIEVCECPDIPNETVCYGECGCEPPCIPLEMVRRLPQTALCAGEYKVSGSDQVGMGGLNGGLLEVYLKNKTDVLRVTYYKGLKHLKSFDEVLPIPDAFITAWAYFVAGIIVPTYGIMMQQQELNFMSLARKELDSLRMHDNNFPDKTRFDPTYPVESKPMTYNGTQSFTYGT